MKKHVLISALLLFSVYWFLNSSPVRADDLDVTIEAGQTITVPMRFWCLEYGRNYPPAVTSVVERAPDGVIAVLQVATAKGTVDSNPYQTQLAIWRVVHGQFFDYAKKGTALAEEIYNESLTVTIAPVPTNTATMAPLVASGVLTISFTEFSPEKDFINPGLTAPDFFGKGILQITNLSQDKVTFTVVQGSEFAPPPGLDQQPLVSQFKVEKPPELPPTGANLLAESGTPMLLAGIGGIMCIALSVVAFRRARRQVKA